ncbi:MAG TPA: SAM-dependent methyltransferase [Nitrospirales bacterium]|nr:SAM-dependent methyltransferase [Nitrospirales bacterium]
MNLGRPELVAKLAARVEQEGPLTFADFMEAALYDPEFGYYMSSDARIGRAGDYYTSPDVHPLFAELIGRQIAQAAEWVQDFTIMEMGAGKGLLARNLLNSYRRENPTFLSRIRYLVVERSPALVSLQKQRLQSLVDEGVRITWIPHLDALPAGSLTGIILSNELVDAFAVHRVVQRPLGLREIFVGWEPVGAGGAPVPVAPSNATGDGLPPALNGRFIEIEAPPCSPALQAYFDRIGVSLEDGHRAEVNLHALDWMRQVGALLTRGLVLTIDYGHTARDLYAPTRTAGTLLCYHRHTVSDTPYLRVGEQDMTAHVDFTSLALAGREAGLEVTGFTNQLHFLLGLGIESAFAGLDPESAEGVSLRNLLRPEGMGATYKILVQHKGMPAPELDGLRSKPYFTGALLAGVPETVAVAP